MLLAVDVGNTNVTFAPIEAGEPGAEQRVPTHSAASAAELAQQLGDLRGVDELVVTSVVPLVTDQLRELCLQRRIGLLEADRTTLPIEIRVDQPAEVGPDRLVNAYAVARLYGGPAIVVDFGTATTFDAVSADGAYLGGAIAPGLELGLAALAEHTALLPRVVLAAPAHAIGRDTVSAMQSGALIGYRGLVERLVAAISAELTGGHGPAPKVILTGGLANSAWAADFEGVGAIDPRLTLRGLALLHAELAARRSAGIAAGSRS